MPLFHYNRRIYYDTTMTMQGLMMIAEFAFADEKCRRDDDMISILLILTPNMRC